VVPRHRTPSIWLPPDDALVEAGAGGERLVAMIRLGYYLTMSLVPISMLLVTPNAPPESWISFYWGIFSVLLSLGLLWAAHRRVYIWGLKYLTFLYDILVITAIIVMVAVTGRPVVAANSQIIWAVYLLIIVMTSVRFDLRVCLFTGFACILAYSAAVAWIASTWDLRAYASSGYANFSWTIQSGRLIMMLVATALSIGIIVRCRRLIFVSGTDRLTGIGNRTYFDEQISAEISRTNRRGGVMSLGFLDLDHFKHFNDKWGHSFGDDVLCAFAKVLEKESRAEDVIARWGGEEFVLLMPGTKKEEAGRHLERIKEALARVQLKGVGDMRLTLSGGVAEYPKDGDQAKAVIAVADHRMLLAKYKGRDQIVLAS